MVVRCIWSCNCNALQDDIFLSTINSTKAITANQEMQFFEILSEPWHNLVFFNASHVGDSFIEKITFFFAAIITQNLTNFSSKTNKSFHNEQLL